MDIGADEFYNHLYYTGNATPGGLIRGKLTGLPGTFPVTLWFGTGILDPPQSCIFGYWHLLPPLVGPVELGSVPQNGIHTIVERIPGTPPSPYDVPMQALLMRA